MSKLRKTTGIGGSAVDTGKSAVTEAARHAKRGAERGAKRGAAIGGLAGTVKGAAGTVAKRARKRNEPSRAQRLADRASGAAGSVRSAGEGIAGAGRAMAGLGSTVRDRAATAQEGADRVRRRLADEPAKRGAKKKKAAAAAGAVGATGAAGAYLLDSEQGEERRRNLRLRLSAAAGKASAMFRGITTDGPTPAGDAGGDGGSAPEDRSNPTGAAANTSEPAKL